MLSSEYVKEVRRIEHEEVKNDSLQNLAPARDSHANMSAPNSHFLATTRRLMHFSNNREPKPTDTVVYIQGSFDLLHNGHIETLKKARALGDFLYVGVWSDDIVNYYKGSNYPILSLHERVLMVLACKYADDVVIGSNYQITKDMIKSLNIKKVVAAKTTEDQVLDQHKSIDPYEVAKELGIYEEFELETQMTVETIAERVV
jgi:ethanolamine-phosphate cytidylyltransferase